MFVPCGPTPLVRVANWLRISSSSKLSISDSFWQNLKSGLRKKYSVAAFLVLNHVYPDPLSDQFPPSGLEEQRGTYIKGGRKDKFLTLNFMSDPLSSK